MKKILMLCAAVMVATFGSARAEEVKLRATSAFVLGTAFSRPFEAFVDHVNETGKGVVQINLIGGPEAIPPFEVGNAVSTGVVDMASSPAAFYTNLLPEADALKLTRTTTQQHHENGCYAMIDELHRSKMNVKYLARTGDRVPFHLYLTKPIDGPDLSGLTIRTTPVYQAMFAGLGANLVRTAPGEVYTALERGTIDGYGWPIQGMLDLGWHEQTKYRVDPGFYAVDVNVLVNLDTWNSLTDEQRTFLEEAGNWIEDRNADAVAINQEETRKQADAGIEVIEFSGKDREKWLETAYDKGWEAVAEVNPQVAEKLRACFN